MKRLSLTVFTLLAYTGMSLAGTVEIGTFDVSTQKPWCGW